MFRCNAVDADAAIAWPQARDLKQIKTLVSGLGAVAGAGAGAGSGSGSGPQPVELAVRHIAEGLLSDTNRSPPAKESKVCAFMDFMPRADRFRTWCSIRAPPRMLP